MAFIKSSTILSNLVQEHIDLLPLLFRFGIRLGLGDETIEEICKEHGIETDFFLHITNSYLDPEYLGKVRLSPKHTMQIADYLEATNRYYIESQLPNIEIHLTGFVRKSGVETPMIQTLPRILQELKEALQERIKEDEEGLLPHFHNLVAQLGTRISEITLEHKANDEEEHERTEALVGDIMNILIRHIRGDFNDNLLFGLLYSLSTLRNDLSRNNRLRARIFMPMIQAMEDALRN